MITPSCLRRAAVLLLTCASLVACDKREWTEIASDENEGGIIGTGILGTITGIGSFDVNGIRIVYDDDLLVESAFGEESPAVLKPGDTISLEAFPEGAGLKALSIQRYRPIIAPVDAVAEDRSWLLALGVRVELGRRATLLRQNEPADWRSLEPGDWIAVDGLWRGDEVIASNVRIMPPRDLAAMRGAVDLTPDGALAIGGVRVEGIEPSSIEPGGLLAVKGKPVRQAGETKLLARRYAIPKFSSKIRRVILEGFASQPRADGGYTVYGSGLTFYSEDFAERMTMQRSLFCGSLDAFFDVEASVPLADHTSRSGNDGDPFRISELSGSECWR